MYIVCVGCIGLVWFALWMILGFSSPEDHPRITPVEKDYILSSTKVMALEDDVSVSIYEQETYSLHVMVFF